MKAQRSVALLCMLALLATMALAQQAAPAKRALTHQDYDSWRSITAQQVSRDGKFVAYAFVPQDGDGEIVARNIANHFAQIDPKNAATYSSNLTKFNARLDAKLTEWQKQLAPYRGAKIVTYHRDFIYLAQRFGLSIVDELEPKPGIAPSPAHLAQVIGEMKRNDAKVILVQPFQNRKTAETVARQTGARVLDTPQQPGAVSNTATYFDMMDNLVHALAAGLGAHT